MLAILIFFLAHWYVSLFFQTAFLHRYAAHQMFTLSPFWEKVFYFMTYATQGSSFLSPYAYTVLHRMHHAYSDTDKDPHTPHESKNVFEMMWKTALIYRRIAYRLVIPEKRFSKNIPMWDSLEFFGGSWPSRTAWGVLYVAFYYYFVPEGMWYLYLLLPIHFLMGPVHGAIVNWCGHMYGHRNFESSDKSTNTLPFDFLMMGELFQNNHHRYPQKRNFGYRWFEIDPTYPFMWILNKLRVIRFTNDDQFLIEDQHPEEKPSLKMTA